MQREARRLEPADRVVIMPYLQFVMKVPRSATLVRTSGSSLLALVYGSAGLSPVEVLENDMVKSNLNN